MSKVRLVDPVTGLRRFAYFVTPNETSFKSENEVPNYINEAVPYFFGLIFLEIIICKLRGQRGIRINDSMSSISAGLFSQLPLVLARSIELTAYRYIYENYRILELPWDSAWTWWIAFLGVDLGYYWFHRFAHEVNFMWAAHQVHHSSEDYNLSTALRQSVLQRYTSWVFYLPMALFVPSQAFMVHIQFNLLYQFWIHTEVIKSLGPLEWILNTPSHHRVHHGRNPYCIDKNYAGTLIIWDRMFGTFTPEAEEIAYGLVHPLTTWDPIFIQFFHLKYIWKRFRKEKGWKNKLSVIFKGPGWHEGTPRLGNHEELPQIELPVKKYDSKLPLFYSCYVLLHFMLVLVGQQEMVARKAGMSEVTVLLFIFYLLYCLTSFGALMDHKWYGPYMEFVRCLLYVLVDLYISAQGPVTSRPVVLHLLQALFIFSTVMWGFICIRLQTNGKLKQHWQ